MSPNFNSNPNPSPSPNPSPNPFPNPAPNLSPAPNPQPHAAGGHEACLHTDAILAPVVKVSSRVTVMSKVI